MPLSGRIGDTFLFYFKFTLVRELMLLKFSLLTVYVVLTLNKYDFQVVGRLAEFL
jgi:hypothetical protein